MSERAPSLLGRIVKWIVFPLLLAAAGVFAVGPYLNKVGLPLPESLKPKQSVQPGAAPDSADSTPDAGKYGQPQVEVSVGPGKTHLRRRSRPLVSSSHHRRRRHRVAAPAQSPDTGDGAGKAAPDEPQSTPPADAAGA